MADSQLVKVADLQRPTVRPLVWLRRHPVVTDVFVMLVACVPQMLAMWRGAGDVGWWGYPLIAVSAVALLFRNRWPFVVLITVAVSGAASPLVQPGFGFPMLPYSVALYTVASRQTTVRAVIAYGIGILAIVVGTAPYSLADQIPPFAAPLDPFSLVALIAGVLVKHRRDLQRRQVELINQRIENAARAERTRIATEMHDVVAHTLTVVVTLANGATSAWQKRPQAAASAVEQIAAVGRDALTEMHHTLRLLRSADLETDEGLHHTDGNRPTLQELTNRFRYAGLPVALIRSGEPLAEDSSLHQAIYRIIQESLTNTLRHADRPTGATVTIARRSEDLAITIDDDGRTQRPSGTPSHGLLGIGQRAAALGGTATSAPRQGGGWRTHVILPLGAEAASGG